MGITDRGERRFDALPLAALGRANAITGEKHTDRFVDMGPHLLVAECGFLRRDEPEDLVIGHD